MAFTTQKTGVTASGRAGLRSGVVVCLLLAVVTFMTFRPVGKLGFLDLDDYGQDGYVVDNPHIHAGINAAGVWWAFTGTHASNWHPLTSLSLMLNYQWFGLNAASYHWVNLGFHVLNTVLLFLVLRRMTGSVGRSALVAALFALHPQRIESVAWISERKDVLSGFFFMLTLWAWAAYVERDRGRSGSSACAWFKNPLYWLALVCYACGLMSKPMLVTLPLVLLALDFWPLQRLPRWPAGRMLQGKTKQKGREENARLRSWPAFRSLLLEKAPFLALSLGDSLLTIRAQASGNGIIPLEHLPWNWRLENALLCYAAYVRKLLWPEHLAIFYPFTYLKTTPVVAGIDGLLLVAFTVFCLWQMHRQPVWAVGWFWFLIMLLPVIGLVQTGAQSIADRYTYLPAIGFYLMLVWGIAGTVASFHWPKMVCPAAGVAVLAACVLAARYQLQFWSDSVTLFTHSLAVTGDNPTMDFYLGNVYRQQGKGDEAAQCYQRMLLTLPESTTANFWLGYVLLQQKRFGAAESPLKKAVQFEPANANAHMCLALDLVSQEKYQEAQAEFLKALILRPGDAVIQAALVAALQKTGTNDIAADRRNLSPTNPSPETQLQLAVVQMARGNFQDAKERCQTALALAPDDPDILNNLAWLLATCPDPRIRDGSQALNFARRACQLTGYRQAGTLGTLAAAYAETGRFEEAIVTANKACDAASATDKPDLLERNQAMLQCYREHQPYHEPVRKQP